MFRRLVTADIKSRSDTDAEAVLEEIPEKQRLRLNQTYPDALPMATMPPKLLQQLPVLPEPLEYRFLGRHLILRDGDANVIVDFIYNALPPDKA